MRTTVILVFSVLISALLAAQHEIREKVLLTDGKSFEGIVIEQIPGEFILFYRTVEKDTLQISFDDIERLQRIVSEPKEEEKKPNLEGKQNGNQDNWWINRARYNTKDTYIMLHGAYGAGDYTHAGFGISLGYYIWDEFMLGIGAQYLGSLSDGGYRNRQTIPVSADVRYLFSQSKKGQFASLIGCSVGYNVVINRDLDPNLFNEPAFAANGLYVYPSIGFRMNMLKNLGLLLELGYHMNNSEIFSKMDTERLIEKRTWHNFMVKGSIFF